MADYQKQKPDFEALDAGVLALSSDAVQEARGTVEQLGLEFPVLCGLDPLVTARAIGCYTGVRQGRPHLQPAAFVLAEDGSIVHAVYSSGKVGRLTASDALTILRGRAAR